MCNFPPLAAKICVLAIIPINSVLCLAETINTVKTISHGIKKDSEVLLYVLLVSSVLYLIGLGVGYYGTIVQNIMLFVIVAYILIMTFVFVVCSNSGEDHKTLINNVWFNGSLVCSVMSFILGFMYFQRLKNYDD